MRIKMSNKYQSDIAVIGGGLAGLVTAIELLDHNKKAIILERDKEEKFGGLAKESFGGIMMVGTPHQKKMGIKDSPELALSDWHRVARFDNKDTWPRQWAEAYVNRSKELIWDWLSKRGVSFLPVVNWPERGLFYPGNSVPRWHIAWGTGYGIIEALLSHLETHPRRNNLQVFFNHRVNRLISTNNKITGCAGILEGTNQEFSAEAGAVVIASGGMCGGDLSKVRENWYKPWGSPPKKLLNGSHRYADGKMLEVVAGLGGTITHLDKQWHYATGIHHPNPDKNDHGLSLVPPRSALWINARGERIGPVPLMGYTDTRYLVEQICKQPGQYSWQIMNWKIAIKELGVSGSEYMTTFRYKKKLRLITELLFGNKELVNRLLKESKDIVTAYSIEELVERMNGMGNEYQVDGMLLAKEIKAYDDQIDRGEKFFTDDQLRRIVITRKYKGDRLRTCKYQKILDPGAMPLIASREFILSRKSMGGIQTNLDCQVMNTEGKPIENLYAVGEAAGFGGGGIHGLGSLEGTFLGGCILTGRIAGKIIPGVKK
jgi:predicted oxidoreductase